MHKNILILLILSITLMSCNSNAEINTNHASENKEENRIEEKNDTTKNKEAKETKQKTTNRLDQLTVHYIDVGQGNATLLTFTDNEDQYTILYDVGDWRGDEVVTYLQQEQISDIDLIIVSHPHADHIGQLDKVIANFTVGEVWMSGNLTNTNVFQSAMEAILEQDIDYDEPRAGDVFDIGPLEIFVLHPESLTGQLNEDSISIRLTYGDVSFIFTGDTYAKEELLMLNRTEYIQADFLQIGHHGSNTSSEPKFIHAVNPKYAIYSAGTGNSYGHPHEEVVNLFANMDIPLYGTDVHGTIMVTTDGIDSVISTEKDGKVKGNQASIDEPVEQTEQTETHLNCIDLNSASKEELMSIIHIGESRADAIIELRPYDAIDDLQRINGIGAARLADIKSEGKTCIGGN